MSINATVTRRSDGGWSFAWEQENSSEAPYQVWLDGLLLASPEEPTYDYVLANADDVPPDLEILTAGDFALNESLPPYVLLQWRGLQTAAAYLVEQFVDASWNNVGFAQELALGTYTWRSRPILDEDDATFRVTAVDLFGNGGTPLEFTKVMVCNPKRPDVTFEVDSSGDVVIS